ncbi:hypothetical protein Ocin01_02545, partial [Orchesella cincta]
ESGAVPQYASLQGHTVVSMSGQPDAFQFPHNSPFFQLAAMDAGTGQLGIESRRRLVLLPHVTSARWPLDEASRPPPPQSAPQALTSGPLNQFKFSKVGDRSELMYESRPEYFVGPNRAPLLSHPIRYEGIPMHSIMYASTASPIARVNNPISYITHGEKNPGEFSEFPSGAGVPGQNQFQLRFQDSRLRSQGEMGNSDNMKYLELPSAQHMHIMHTDGGSRIAPSSGGAPPLPAWAQTRNLPKREQKHPYFSEPTAHFNKERIRTNLKNLGRDVRANDNLYEMGKMDERNNSPLQSSAQVRGNNKGIRTIPLQNQPRLFPALRLHPGNHETVNPRSHPSTSFHTLHASQVRHLAILKIPPHLSLSPLSLRAHPLTLNISVYAKKELDDIMYFRSGPRTQGALEQGDMPSRAEKGSGSSKHAEGLLNTNLEQQQHNCEQSSCRHDSNLEPSQQLPSSKQAEKGLIPPTSTTLSQPSAPGKEGGDSTLPKLSKPSRQDDRKDVHVNEQEDVVKRQDEGKGQDEGVPKSERKDGDGEEEGSAPDPLSLTLLTDIWQTINQDNGSKTPSQKPPAVPPPPPSHRQIPRGMVASGGRNRPALVFPIRRQPPPPPISPVHHFGQRAF